jgi:tetratricopeptide (TPR) repeat protein
MSLLTDFVEKAPHGTAGALAALACAESLTDRVALAIYEQAPVPGLKAEDFLGAFKYSGLTEPRNSEWNLAPALREELVASQVLNSNVKKDVHRLLLSLGQDGENRKKAGSEIPAYLFTEAGTAYHLAGVGDVAGALEHYSAVSRGAFNGAQWLGAKLADEQERTQVIPQGSIEVTFLRAWVMLREGRRQEAMPLFRRVAATDVEKREVAISLHIIGNENFRGQRQDAERELRRSIEIGGNLGDQFGVAQTLHSLANFLSRQDSRLGEAEEAYRQSIKIKGELGDQFGVAQTLHSLANFLSRQDSRRGEAEESYRRSIEMFNKLGEQFGVAQTLHSLANLLSRRDSKLGEAEESYRRSIEIDSNLGNQFGVAQTLHSLANLLSRQDGRLGAAEESYRRSIEIDSNLGNQFGVAQTQHSLANLLSRQDGRLGEAEESYQQSLELGEKLRNENHLAQVLRSYALAIEPRSSSEAIALLQRSLDINRRRGNEGFVRLVERTIREVQRRAK